MRLDRRSIECGKAIVVLGVMTLIAGMSQTVPTTANVSVTTEVVTREAVYASGDTSANAGITLSLDYNATKEVEGLEETDNTQKTSKKKEKTEQTDEDTSKEEASKTSEKDKKESESNSADDTDDTSKKDSKATETKTDTKKDTADDSKEKESEATEQTDEKSEDLQAEEKTDDVWSQRVMVNVDEYLNIREQADENSEIVGKLYKGSAGDVIEKGDEWTKISSGSVEGYVKNEYILFGDEAKNLAQEEGTYIATVTADTLKLRSEASTESSVVNLAAKGETFEIVSGRKKEFIGIDYNGEKAYISSEYADVELEVSEAVSIEEEQAAAQAEAQQQSEASAVTADTAAYVSNDDTALLAALIWCEAGGESYEGQLAVGSVVMNRVYSSSFPGSISEVIYQSGQFTPAMNGKVAGILASGSYSSSCYTAAQQAMAGVNNIGSALYFCSGASVSGTVIGNQTFY